MQTETKWSQSNTDLRDLRLKAFILKTFIHSLILMGKCDNVWMQIFPVVTTSKFHFTKCKNIFSDWNLWPSPTSDSSCFHRRRWFWRCLTTHPSLATWTTQWTPWGSGLPVPLTTLTWETVSAGGNFDHFCKTVSAFPFCFQQNNFARKNKNAATLAPCKKTSVLQK